MIAFGLKTLRHFRRRGSTYAVLLVGTGIVWIVLEISLHVYHYGFAAIPPERGFERYHRRYEFKYDRLYRAQFQDSYLDLNLPTSIVSRPHFENEKRVAALRAAPQGNGYLDGLSVESGLWSDDPRFFLAPNRKTRARRVAPDGDTVYDVIYGVDGRGLRETTNLNPKGRTKHLMVLGCSFVFGEGVSDAETLPSRIAQRTKKYLVYNMGVQGTGPHDLGMRIENPELGNTVKESEGLAIYMYIPDHVRRTVPSISMLGKRMGRPVWLEDGSGNIQRFNSYAEADPWGALFLRILSWSNVLWALGLDFPPSFGEEHFRKTAHTIAYVSKMYKTKFPKGEFVALIYPYEWDKGVMGPYLTHYGVKVLDYSVTDISKLVQAKWQLSPQDGHPSAEAHDVIADQITRDLNLK